MRPSPAAVLAIAALFATGALAQEIKDTPTPVAALVVEAAGLIGKAIDYDAQKKIFDRSPHAKDGDWSFGLEVGEEGPLVRAAETGEIGKGKLSIRTESDFNERCARPDAELFFTIGMDTRLNAKDRPEQAGDHATAFASFADHGVFSGAPRKIALGYNWDAGDLGFSISPAEMARHGELALCRSAKPTSATSADCAIFSLKGFQRADEFVCSAK